jgi:hypothetical protein
MVIIERCGSDYGYGKSPAFLLNVNRRVDIELVKTFIRAKKINVLQVTCNLKNAVADYKANFKFKMQKLKKNNPLLSGFFYKITYSARYGVVKLKPPRNWIF